MRNQNATEAAVGVAAAGMAAQAAPKGGVEQFITRIKSDNAEVRTSAWLMAGRYGAAAVAPLAEVAEEGDMEVSRAAKRAMWQIVRKVGAPRQQKRKAEVVAEILKLVDGSSSDALNRETLQMLSEIGGPECVDAIAKKLASATLRDHAIFALQRIPGKQSLQALKAALKEAPKECKPAIAQALRARGQEVPGIPCLKMVPTRRTEVKPL